MTAPSALIEVVRQQLPSLAPEASFDAERGEVLVPVPEGRARISIDTLAKTAATTPAEQWPDLVTRWLATLKSDLAAAEAGGTTSADQLRVQIKPHADTPPDEVLVLPYDDQFDVAVVVDHETRVSALTYAQIAALGLTVDEIGRRAVKQTITNELTNLDVRDHTLPNGVVVRVVAQDGNPYVSAILMSLDRFTAGDAPHGVLVAVPQYSAVVLHEVTSQDAVDFLVPFSRIAKSMRDDARDPFDTGLYWWANGVFHRVEIEETGEDTARAHLPSALRDLVEALPDGS
ncbi:hypothetical protein [Nocardia sp. NRRL S-836]|uniref:hypothetical protein n=1 Tax=Nocardia sp. NRRL S-836 TaxID=1519492 RepID=UPI0006ADE019|nr:hypothetical protein [Nocardia sp. NRRL S-836]KOV78217.1 hypothetical protein ADL03_40550 [Nocardia sp. NRRL S-836]